MIRNISKLFFKWKIKTFLNISFPFSPYFLAETSLQIEKEKKKKSIAISYPVQSEVTLLL